MLEMPGGSTRSAASVWQETLHRASSNESQGMYLMSRVLSLKYLLNPEALALPEPYWIFMMSAAVTFRPADLAMSVTGSLFDMLRAAAETHAHLAAGLPTRQDVTARSLRASLTLLQPPPWRGRWGAVAHFFT